MGLDACPRPFLRRAPWAEILQVDIFDSKKSNIVISAFYDATFAISPKAEAVSLWIYYNVDCLRKLQSHANHNSSPYAQVMLEPYDDFNEFYINVEVKNPKIEDGSYVSYEIAIETNNISFTEFKSSVRRRYSEFVQLRKLLVKEFPAWNLPALPPKFPFKNHFTASFIENRRKGLEDFVNKLVSEKIFLSSKALHLFLQSTHSISEIEEIINKKVSTFECSDNSCINERCSNSLADDMSTLSVSSHNDMDASVNLLPAQNSEDDLTTTSTTNIRVPPESKRVSFSDQVTVAQIYVD